MSSVSCVCWEWQRDDGGFSPYLPEVSNEIEAANHAGLGWHNLGSARVYTVDFARMIQRKNASGARKPLTRELSELGTCSWHSKDSKHKVHILQNSGGGLLDYSLEQWVC